MDLWEKLVFPVRRVWVAVTSRVHRARTNGGGILKLRDDVQTCGYEDIQVMWEMLRRSEEEAELSHNHLKRKRHRPFWRFFVWSNAHSTPSTTASALTSTEATFLSSKGRMD
ncbi:hypothetical protein RJ641_020269 [Dillenia turbinata]|uniref:Uncharacterized protein n=1 Tax=Dillenia turbinata TaxID=194707 RepID=A0AAN8YW77_9MAGN